MKNIVLGITASISAYKAVDLTRRLKERNYAVQGVMTQGAQAFAHLGSSGCGLPGAQ